MYCRIASQKFFFFDPNRRGKACIKKVLPSNCLQELMELHQESEEEVTDTEQAENWFSLTSAQRICDMNGTLSKQELREYADGTLTDIFIERAFDEHLRRRKSGNANAWEMDFESFLDFVLALENKVSPEGITYLFKCLDLNGRGFLTTADIHTLFRDVHQKWIEGGNYELCIEDVRDEIWDMVKPADPLKDHTFRFAIVQTGWNRCKYAYRTRNSAIEPQVDETVRNWVTRQVNEKFDNLTNMINELAVTQQFLVNDVNRLKNGESSSRFGRMSKLEFPKFHGEDVKGWMYRVKQFFTVDGVREEDKVKIVFIYIYDKALAWHLQFVRTQGKNVTWPVYEEVILKRFGEVNEDLMAELNNLRYKTTMKQYQSDFESLLNQVEITEALYTPLLPTPRNTYENKNVTYPAKPTTTTLALPNTHIVTKYSGDKCSGQMFVLEVSHDEGENMEGNVTPCQDGNARRKQE
ncbi:probable serine/threonine-protein phosphatase 2A regulatory subunit B'' subunit TON2 [Tanacetum coccineum]